MPWQWLAQRWRTGWRPKRRATHDLLTGLLNRHAFHELVASACLRKETGSIVLLDLDHFKQVNDRHGHSQGDRLLVEVARRLTRWRSDGMHVGRFGGDEFALFLPGVPVPEAVPLVDECLAVIRRPLGDDVPGMSSITCSAGIASLSRRFADEAYRAVDVALYAAKARGRDRAVVFDDETRPILEARRELAATVIELQRQNRELADAVRTDPLTGLLNRRALDEALESPESRGAGPSAVAFIDVDHFGAFNKRYTDAAGDEALRAVSRAMRDAARGHDLVYRKGGEEFVAIFQDVEAEDARRIADRMRAAVRSLAIEHLASATAPVLTITVALASGAPGVSWRALLGMADGLAMQAKREGRRDAVHATHQAGAPQSEKS